MGQADNRKIDEHLMDKIEQLSMLKLNEEERQKAMREMEQILSYVDVLNQLNTDEVEGTIHHNGLKNRVREDEITNEAGALKVLANAPASHNNQIIVPKTIG